MSWVIEEAAEWPGMSAALVEAAKRAPNVPADAMLWAAVRFVSLVDGSPVFGRKQRDELAALDKAAHELGRQIDALSFEAGDAVAHAAPRLIGTGGFLQTLRGDLRQLSNMAEVARRQVEEWERPGPGTLAPRTKLVHCLALMLSDLGHEVNARPNGELCEVFGALMAVEVVASHCKADRKSGIDIPSTAKAALKSWIGKSATRAQGLTLPGKGTALARG